MQQLKHRFLPILGRLMMYGIVVLSVNFVIIHDAGSANPAGLFLENSLTEWVQETFILFVSLIFAYIAFSFPAGRGFSVLISGLSLSAFIREYNNFFHLQFSGAWQLLVLIVLVITMIFVIRNRKNFLSGFQHFLESPAMGIMFSGFLIVMIFSRLFGKKAIWKDILNVPDLQGTHRWVKNAAEEGTELLGYALILCAAIEYLQHVIRQKKLTTKEA